MLVLSRKIGQAVVIRDRETKEVITRISVVEVIHPLTPKVRLGFESDYKFEIHREEVMELVDAEQQQQTKTEHDA